MSRRRAGVVLEPEQRVVELEARVAELEHRRELMAAELAHAEAEADRLTTAVRVQRDALRRISDAESGYWGRVAWEALTATRGVV